MGREATRGFGAGIWHDLVTFVKDRSDFLMENRLRVRIEAGGSVKRLLRKLRVLEVQVVRIGLIWDIF